MSQDNIAWCHHGAVQAYMLGAVTFKSNSENFYRLIKVLIILSSITILRKEEIRMLPS